MKTKPLSEQVALVTGGGTGIGRALTEALAAAGVRVVIAARRSEVLRRTADEINAALNSELISLTILTFAIARKLTSWSRTCTNVFKR